MHPNVKKLFKQDIIDLFSHKRGGHVQKWIYNDQIRPDNTSGSTLWHNFITSSADYYPIQHEIDLIPQLTNQISHDFDTVIDFGLGNQRAINNKTIPILLSQTNLKRYIAIDVSENSLLGGTQRVKNQFNKIHISRINGDFYNQHDVEGIKRLGLFLGSTISNQDMIHGEEFPRNSIVNHLKTLGNTVKNSNQGTLIISFDSNPDLKSALSAYQHPSWISMMTGLMHDVAAELTPSGDFNPSMWHYAPKIDVQNNVLHHIICPTIDQTFCIGNIEFNLKKDDQFVIINCFKYPIDLFSELLTEAGFTPSNSPVRSTHNTMTLIDSHI